MFFPFSNYRRITFSSDTNGGSTNVFTSTEKSFIVLEIPATGVTYQQSIGANCWYNGSGSTAVSIFAWNTGGAGAAALGNILGGALAGSAVIPSGYNVFWKADNAAGSETITLHVFEMPTTLP